MQPYPYRHIRSVATAFSGKWTLWYALGLYSFISLVGLASRHSGSRSGDLNLAIGLGGLALLAIGWLRLRAVRTLPIAPFDPYAPGWVRAWPMTHAVLAFARRRRAQQLALAGGITVLVTVPFALVNRHDRQNLIVAIIAGIVCLAIMLATMRTYSDTGSTTYWEVAGPLRGEGIWQMTRAAYALYVGDERLIVAPKAARQIAGVPWGVVMAMRRTAEVIEVRDWSGNVVYRAPGYRP